MDTLETIKNRRSIRKYKADPVDDKTLEIILEAGRQAPSWTNTQCWKFIVVRDSAIKSRLAESLISPGAEFAENPAANGLKSAPVALVACAEKGISGYKQGQPVTSKGEFWYLFDVATAMENMMLAAASQGLGMVIIGLFDNCKVADILSIPDNFEVVVISPLGYPEYQPKTRPRKELGEIVFREKFGQK